MNPSRPHVVQIQDCEPLGELLDTDLEFELLNLQLYQLDVLGFQLCLLGFQLFLPGQPLKLHLHLRHFYASEEDDNLGGLLEENGDRGVGYNSI